MQVKRTTKLLRAIATRGPSTRSADGPDFTTELGRVKLRLVALASGAVRALGRALLATTTRLFLAPYWFDRFPEDHDGVCPVLFARNRGALDYAAGRVAAVVMSCSLG